MQVGVDLANFPVVRVDDCLQEKLNALKGHLTPLTQSADEDFFSDGQHIIVHHSISAWPFR